MSDFIFKKEYVIKENLYARIKEILIETGWQNISSRPSTEFDIFFSEGDKGDKKIFFQMKEYGSVVAQAFSSSVYSTLYCRLIKSYEPSQTIGTAGKIERAEGWKGVNINYSSNLNPKSPMIIHYHCNLNRLVLIVEYPPSLGSLTYSSYFSIGYQDRTFRTKNPNENVILASTHFDSSTGVGVYVADQIGNPRTASYVLTSYDIGDVKSVSINDTLFFSEIAYGLPAEGIRGMLDGVYSLRDTSTNISLSQIKQGDEFIDEDGKRYRILQTYNTSNNSLVSRYFAFRIE